MKTVMKTDKSKKQSYTPFIILVVILIALAVGTYFNTSNVMDIINGLTK